MFVDPMIIIDMRSFSCLTLKVCLHRFIKTASNKTRMVLSLMNRSKNKPTVLKLTKELLITENLKLMEFSKIFLKINSVYKQASIERQSIRKKAQVKS